MKMKSSLKISQSFEYAQEQLTTMIPTEVHAVNKYYYKKEVNRGTSQASKSPGYHKPITMRRKPQRQQQCGNEHKHIWPAKAIRCDNCKKWNHFTKCVVQVFQTKNHRYMRLTPNQCTLTQILIFFIDSIESKVKQYQAFAKLLVGPNSTPVNFKLDTGSQVNIIPEKVYDKLGVIGILQNPTHKLSTYNGHTP
jgi:hypothetical protein